MTAAPEGGTSVPLFVHELRFESRPIVSLRALSSGGSVVVETTVHPVGSDHGDAPIHRAFPFASTLQATRFADEALMAFEHLGCTLAAALRLADDRLTG